MTLLEVIQKRGNLNGGYPFDKEFKPLNYEDIKVAEKLAAFLKNFPGYKTPYDTKDYPYWYEKHIINYIIHYQNEILSLANNNPPGHIDLNRLFIPLYQIVYENFSWLGHRYDEKGNVFAVETIERCIEGELHFCDHFISAQGAAQHLKFIKEGKLKFKTKSGVMPILSRLTIENGLQSRQLSNLLNPSTNRILL